MIYLKVMAEKDKIFTEFNTEKVTQGEASLLCFELDRIKLNLLDKDFQADFEAKS